MCAQQLNTYIYINTNLLKSIFHVFPANLRFSTNDVRQRNDCLHTSKLYESNCCTTTLAYTHAYMHIQINRYISCEKFVIYSHNRLKYVAYTLTVLKFNSLHSHMQCCVQKCTEQISTLIINV